MHCAPLCGRLDLLPLRIGDVLVAVIDLDRQLQDGHHAARVVHPQLSDRVVIADGIANKAGQAPVAGNEVANHAVIGVELGIFLGQIGPPPRLTEMPPVGAVSVTNGAAPRVRRSTSRVPPASVIVRTTDAAPGRGSTRVLYP